MEAENYKGEMKKFRKDWVFVALKRQISGCLVGNDDDQNLIRLTFES